MDLAIMEDKALERTSLLKVLCAVDTDNAGAVREMPIAIRPAAELAEYLYCTIADRKREVQ